MTKRRWDSSNPLYRWLHKRKKRRSKARSKTPSKRATKRIGRMGRGGIMSGAKMLLSVLGLVFVAKTGLDVATGGKGITTGSGIKLYG